MIKHLRHHEIDKASWDARLIRCPNRLWYAQSWVLDIACPGWEALIDDAADAMMPLTCRRKWSVSYLFQPLGIQQLGVFASMPANELADRFIEAIPGRFRYIDIALNEAMRPSEAVAGKHSASVNQVIELDRPINELRAAYSTGHRRNLKDAAAGLHAVGLEPGDFETLFRHTTGARYGDAAVKGLKELTAVIAEGIRRDQCRIEALAEDGEVIAAACFASWEGRSILLKSANTESGHRAKAMFHLTDAWIARSAGTGMLLDFAGSNTPSVARFNAGFGAVTRPYFRLRRNRLPLLARWLKN